MAVLIRHNRALVAERDWIIAVRYNFPFGNYAVVAGFYNKLGTAQAISAIFSVGVERSRSVQS